VSSIRSRQTGHVGNSTKAGVGGGKGLKVRLLSTLTKLGVNGSRLVFVYGKEPVESADGVSKTIDLQDLTVSSLIDEAGE
jgi:hypothetical protein